MDEFSEHETMSHQLHISVIGSLMDALDFSPFFLSQTKAAHSIFIFFFEAVDPPTWSSPTSGHPLATISRLTRRHATVPHTRILLARREKPN
jgi:hypothetical protein